MKSLHKFSESGNYYKNARKEGKLQNIPSYKSNLLAMETFLRSLEQLMYCYRSHYGAVIDRRLGRNRREWKISLKIFTPTLGYSSDSSREAAVSL